eukprot:scaffold499_cov335-Pavlova_lutheri.AAC.29
MTSHTWKYDMWFKVQRGSKARPRSIPFGQVDLVAPPVSNIDVVALRNQRWLAHPAQESAHRPRVSQRRPPDPGRDVAGGISEKLPRSLLSILSPHALWLSPEGFGWSTPNLPGNLRLCELVLEEPVPCGTHRILGRGPGLRDETGRRSFQSSTRISFLAVAR